MRGAGLQHEDISTMNSAFDTSYFEWLVQQIKIDQEHYSEMLHLLHGQEFVWVIPNDDNRVHDGLDLRTEFADDVGGVHRFHQGVSVLEVIVGLSRRIAFAAGGQPNQWAYRLIENLGLHKLGNPLSLYDKTVIGDILETLIWRKYKRDGYGGFFPLIDTDEDQTKVEIWYQMNAYIEEQPRV